jgi:hypothetical protein
MNPFCLIELESIAQLSSIFAILLYRYHLPPKINMPHVQLELPYDRPLRPIVERLKISSPHCKL